MKGISNMSSILIGIIVAIGVLQGMYAFYGSLYRQYDVGDVNASYSSEMFGYSEDVSGMVQESEGNLTSYTPVITEVFGFVANGWKAVKMFYELPGTLTHIIASSISNTEVEIPYWINFLLSALIWIIVFVTIIKVIFKREI